MSLTYTRSRLIVVSAFILCIAFVAAARFGIISEANTLAPSIWTMEPLAPGVVTAVKSAALQTDVNGNGFVNPGDSLAYSVLVANGKHFELRRVLPSVRKNSVSLAR